MLYYMADIISKAPGRLGRRATQHWAKSGPGFNRHRIKVFTTFGSVLIGAAQTVMFIEHIQQPLKALCR